MILLAGRVIDDEELKENTQTRQPYGEWLDSNLIELEGSEDPESEEYRNIRQKNVHRLQKAFGYSYEDVKTSIQKYGKERWRRNRSHGNGCTTSVLSEKHQNLFDYFKQLFAQVTNPPIDAIREEVVTSTTIYIGEDGNLLEAKRRKLQDAQGQ